MPPPYAPLVFTRLPVDPGFPITTHFGEILDLGAGPYPHRGVDFGCPVGTMVYAPAGGTVVAFTNDGSFGTAICIDHDKPNTEWYSLLAHLSQAKANVGDVVVAGQPIGLSGATGKVTGPHLHWQVCKSKTFPVDITMSADPLSFLAPSVPATLEARVAALEEANRQAIAQRTLIIGKIEELIADIRRAGGIT